MLSHTDLKKGTEFILDKDPYEVLDSSFVFKGRGSSVVQTKIKNLITGNVLSRTFHPGDSFREAEIEKAEAVFIFSHRDTFTFHEAGNPSARFELQREVIGESANYLKSKETVEAIKFNGTIINVLLPIKVQLKVLESPPGVRGDRAQGGTKTAKLETGVTINVPLFVEEGDMVEVNSETGEYVRRVE